MTKNKEVFILAYSSSEFVSIMVWKAQHAIMIRKRARCIFIHTDKKQKETEQEVE